MFTPTRALIHHESFHDDLPPLVARLHLPQIRAVRFPLSRPVKTGREFC